MRAWRLARHIYAALDGEGAWLNGGRWNSAGNSVVYMSSHLSLAILELLVHTDSDVVPPDLEVFEIEIPDALSVETIPMSSLPTDWRLIPNHPECQMLGDQWVKSKASAILIVPSAIVSDEVNYLVNPRHVDAKQIRIIDSKPFSFDSRLLNKPRTTAPRKRRKPTV